MTHPSARRQGLAALAIEKVIDFFKEQNVDFALLFCEPHIMPIYQQIGWQPFTGDLLVTQRGAKGKFTFNLPMVKPICSAVLTTGVIDIMVDPGEHQNIRLQQR